MVKQRKLLILYGSQTGTAQSVAERIGREAKRLHFDTKVKAMDDYEPISDIANEELAAFVCATTGQGDQPDNMIKFWRFLLKRTLPKDTLSGLNFGVLGLGDSGYAQFNYAAKRLNRRLAQVGGTAILPIGLADDQHDVGADYVIDPWMESFWKAALEIAPLPAGLEPMSSDVLADSKYLLDFDDLEVIEATETKSEVNGPNCPFMATLVSNQRMTSEDHFQDTRLIDLHVADGLKFNPGDVCLVQPQNSEVNVKTFLSLMKHLDPDKKFKLVKRDENVQFPPKSVLVSEVTTLREAALRLFDLQAIPGRYFFELLSKFTKDDLEKEKFKEFTTAEGQQDLYEYCNRPRRNGLEVLNDFSLNTVPNIPMEYLFDLFPVIKPRSFSIANSLKSVENVVQLLVAVVKYRSKLVDPRIGLCSNWLTGLAADKDQQQKVPIWIKKGTLKFPTNDPKIPIVMVGPGTGVAPFRSIITDELEQGSKRPMVLIFGNRNKDKDFYFKAEWDKLQSNHDNFKLFTAFSRDQEDKYYVQDVIKANKGQISDWICNGQGIFYIAGNAKQMPDQVKDALKEAIQSLDEDKTDEDFNVNKYLSQMEAEKRFQTETWS